MIHCSMNILFEQNDFIPGGVLYFILLFLMEIMTREWEIGNHINEDCKSEKVQKYWVSLDPMPKCLNFNISNEWQFKS